MISRSAEKLKLSAPLSLLVAGGVLVSRNPKFDAYPATRVWDRVYEKTQ